jgi:hypothetical protein
VSLKPIILSQRQNDNSCALLVFAAGCGDRLRNSLGPAVRASKAVQLTHDLFTLFELGRGDAKGSIAGIVRIGRKISIGDKHSPEIMDAVYVAGTMELQHGHNKGPSSWCASNIVQYQNGKRALVTMQNAKWRA